MRIGSKLLALGIFVAAASTTLNPTATGAQQGASEPLYLPGHNYDLPATLIAAADLQAAKTKMLAAKTNDVPVKMVNMGGLGGKHQMGVSLVYRLKGETNSYAVHDQVAEVYHVLEGSGTLLLGGKLKDAKRRPISGGNGPGLSGDVAEGSVEMHIAKGDVLIIPAGTPHKVKMTDEFMLYTVVRADPDGVTPLLK